MNAPQCVCAPMCLQITHITECLITHITQIQALAYMYKAMSLRTNPISELRTYYKRDRHTAVPQYVRVEVGANYFVSGMIYDRRHRQMASSHYEFYDVSSEHTCSRTNYYKHHNDTGPRRCVSADVSSD